MATLERSRALRPGWKGPTLVGLLLAAVIGGLSFRSQGVASSLANVETSRVLRTSLASTVKVPGDVDSSEKTLIECEIEAIVFRNGGAALSTKGASTILELMPEGSIVEEGDILCRLDSSDFEEIVRQQEIEVEEDRADYAGFLLDLESNEIRLREYRDGQLEQQKQQLQGQIALAEADLNRQISRLEWSQRMLDIGYLPLSQFAAEQQKMQQVEITLARTRLAFDNLVKYSAPKMILTLQSHIDTARARVTYFESRLRQNEQLLQHYRELVDKCTIRAPHAGFLIYCNEDDGDSRIELGSTVRQRQDLFYLPDLTQMEIKARLHETILRRVSAGMTARVRVESLPGVELEGEVVAVAPLPISKRSWRQSDDVKNFEARIQLHAVPAGLMPGMSAEVEIETAFVPDALVIPPGALAVDEGRDICYVAVEGHLERRDVVIGQYHPEMVQILSGLAEGEQVVTVPEELAWDEIQVVDSVPSSNGISDPSLVEAASDAVERDTVESLALAPPLAKANLP